MRDVQDKVDAAVPDVCDPLPCQRSLFEVPGHVSYLDAAAWSPLPRAVREAGEAGIGAKARPWAHERGDVDLWTQRARVAAARLIGARADDMAIVGSVSHAIATAARNLAPAAGGRILRVADEFSSQRHAWDRLALERGLIVEEVPRPTDGDWTAALLAAIARPGAPPLAVATLTPLHWSNGAIIDLAQLAPAVHATGAALVVDATQLVGAGPIDVSLLQPDFLAFPTYKWALGPYGLAFLYAAPHRQDGVPLEANSGNMPPVVGARRYDKGERDDLVAVSMAATGLEMAAAFAMPAVAARLRTLTDRLAEGALAMGLHVVPRSRRSRHILGVRVPGGLPADAIERLRKRDVFASSRGGGLRLSPHVWADEADVARCLAALREVLRPL